MIPQVEAKARGDWTAGAIQSWIVDYLAEVLDVRAAEIPVDAPVQDLGLDSAVVVALSGDLEDLLQLDLDPSIMLDSPTIQALATQLALETKRSAERTA